MTRLMPVCALLLSAGLAALVPAASVAAQSFTIDQVYGYHFPSELVAARAGDRIAWSADERGQRNVWVAMAPDWRPRRLTSYERDDGQEITGLAFTPDGGRIVYARGGAPNSRGDLPNPTSDPDGVERELWVVPFDGGDPERLGRAAVIALSPTEPVVVWAAGNTVHRMHLDAGVAEELFTVRGGASQLQWSPDGTRLAFASPRDGRAILGTYDIAAGRLDWITNTADRDGSPRWARDGRRIAFVRFPAGEQGYAVSVVDVATKRVRELWRSPDSDAGRYPRAIAGSYDLMYGDGHIVFASEITGWNHLYSIPESGGEPRELTPGDGIVENATLAPDGRSVYVSTNTRGIDWRQLGRIELASGSADWIEDGPVIAWAPTPTAGGSLAYIRSTAREPARVWWTEDARTADDGGADRIAVSPLPPDWPGDALVEPVAVKVATTDGWEIPAQLFLPRNARGPVPAVVFMHGGSRRQMLLGFHNRGYYHGAYAFNQYLVSKGYAVLSVNYRSGIGYGVKFREPPEYGARGGSEYRDIAAAGRYLQSRPEIDAGRIGLWGGSYGGYLTAMGLARNSDIFKAGVDLHGVHDWSTLRGNPGDTELERAEWQRIAYASSPLADIDTWTSPVLLVHADDDRNVPFQQTIDLVVALREKGDVVFEELYFPDDVHGFLLHRNWKTVFETAADFFDRHLRAR